MSIDCCLFSRCSFPLTVSCTESWQTRRPSIKSGRRSTTMSPTALRSCCTERTVSAHFSHVSSLSHRLSWIFNTCTSLIAVCLHCCHHFRYWIFCWVHLITSFLPLQFHVQLHFCFFEVKILPLDYFYWCFSALFYMCWKDVCAQCLNSVQCVWMGYLNHCLCYVKDNKWKADKVG